MIVSSRFTFDTNILIYSVDRSGGNRHDIAVDLVEKAADKDCYLTVQVLGEFYHAVTRKNHAKPDQAIAFTRIWQQIFPVAAANQDTFNDAVEYVCDHNISFWDAMLWVTAKQTGCGYIISEDMQHGRRLGGVEVLNPFAKDAKPALSRLLK